MTPPKLSRRDMERAILALEAECKRLAGHSKLLGGAVAWLMHERGETVVDITVPAWVRTQECVLGSAFNPDGSILITRNAYLRPPVETAEIEAAE